jgi:uncharacterized protein YceK
VRTTSTRTTLSLLCVLALAGCMTLETRSNPSYDGSRVYSGTRVSGRSVALGVASLNIGLLLIYGLDLPFSFLADTVLLPLTLREERERRATHEEPLASGEEAPSVSLLIEGADPLVNARQLFAACDDLLRGLRPQLVDCYAVDARIHITDGDEVRELTGIEYKREILATMEGNTSGHFVSLSDPIYIPEGDHLVRITATRSSSFRRERAPIEWLVGPGPDGGWRILEETGPGWK